MRFYLAVLICAACLSACGSGTGGQRDQTPSTAAPSALADREINRCVDRLLRGKTSGNAATKAAARRYVRDTYCARFTQNGWVFPDGALRIAAQTWLEEGGRCASSSGSGPAATVPCKPDFHGGVRVLECALLHSVRRSEVKDYIDRLQAKGPVECDDGTPLRKLGVP